LGRREKESTQREIISQKKFAAVRNSAAVPLFDPTAGKSSPGSDEAPLFYIPCGCWFFRYGRQGLTHPDLSRMKRALGHLRSKAPSP